jgi:arylsulfatase
VLTQGAKSPHESFFFIYGKHAALRKGDWKIVREKPDQPWQLFDLANDLREAHNLANDQPERVAELIAAFADWEKSFVAKEILR